MKIIFLDIDGVLNSKAYERTLDYCSIANIDESRIPLLKQIVDTTGAKIVLSTSWRKHWDKDVSKCSEDGKLINDCLERYGLYVYDKTPFIDDRTKKYDDIKSWLSEHNDVEQFVILDDEPFGWGELQDYLVKTDYRIGRGLERIHVEQAIEILNRI